MVADIPDEIRQLVELTSDATKVGAGLVNECGPSQDPLRRLAAPFIARAAQSLVSTRSLATAGLNGDALSCARTIVELAVDFAYIALDERRIDRFFAYTAVNENKRATNVRKYAGDDFGHSEYLQSLSDAEARFRESHSNDTRNWAGESFKQRAKAINREDLYDLAYDEMCVASHSGPGTLDYAVTVVDGRRELVYGSTAADPQPMRVALAAFSTLLCSVADACKVPQEIALRAHRLEQRINQMLEAVTVP